jgi:hypothetical protein
MIPSDSARILTELRLNLVLAVIPDSTQFTSSVSGQVDRLREILSQK